MEMLEKIVRSNLKRSERYEMQYIYRRVYKFLHSPNSSNFTELPVLQISPQHSSLDFRRITLIYRISLYIHLRARDDMYFRPVFPE